MTCKWCVKRAHKTISKTNKATSSNDFKEFKSRLECPKCNCKFPDFIEVGESYFKIYYYNLKTYFSEDYDYLPNFKRQSKSHSYNSDILGELIRSGWEINDEKFGGVELFFEACAVDDIEKVNILIDLGLNIEKYGNDALKFACAYSSFKVYERLKQLEIKPTVEDAFIIVKQTKFEMLERILDDGFDVNCNNDCEKSLIHAAAETGSINMVKMLVERGADIHALTEGGYNICHYACHSRSTLRLVKYLFEHGFDFNRRDSNGETPLIVAIDNGNYSVAEFLIEKRAAINLCNYCGDGPLHRCSDSGQINLVKALIKSGADINAKNNNGNTPLHLASKCNSLKEHEIIIDFLLENGADVNILNNDLRFPLSLLLHGRINQKLLKNFIIKGANLNFKCPSGELAYDWVKLNYPKILKKIEKQKSK